MRSCVALVLSLTLAACGPGSAGSDPSGQGGDDGGGGQGGQGGQGVAGAPGGAGGSSGGSGGSPPSNRCPPPPECPAGGTVQGRVLAPNGMDPVDEALISKPLTIREFPPEVRCEVCGDPEDAYCAAVHSRPDGSFILDRMPTGRHTLVIQKGRFRKKLEVDIPCGTLDLTAEQTRLPRNPMEGDIPKIAVATGDFDQIECVLNKIGLDATAFDRYEGASAGLLLPTGLRPFSELVTNYDLLRTYNVVFVNCTQDAFEQLLAMPTVQANLERYVGAGGRLYLTDWSYDWVEQVPQFSPYIDFGRDMSGAAPEAPNGAAVGPGMIEIEAEVVDPGLKEWMRGAGALGAGDTVHVKDFLQMWVMMLAYGNTTIEWVRGNVPGAGVVPLTVTFDYNQCGRVLFSSYHTLGRDPLSFLTPYPMYCRPEPLSPQERILEYLIFEISACVQIG